MNMSDDCCRPEGYWGGTGVGLGWGRTNLNDHNLLKFLAIMPIWCTLESLKRGFSWLKMALKYSNCSDRNNQRMISA
jgi:hypothetical protein